MRFRLNQNRCFYRLWLLVSFLGLFLLTCSIAFASIILFVSDLSASSKPSSTTVIHRPTATVPPSADFKSIQSVVNNYYQALKDNNYDKAISFFTQDGVITTQDSHEPQSVKATKEALQQLNTNQGPIESFIVSSEVQSDNDTIIVYILVSRSNQLAYQVTIALKKNANSWKITQAQGI